MICEIYFLIMDISDAKLQYPKTSRNTYYWVFYVYKVAIILFLEDLGFQIPIIGYFMYIKLLSSSFRKILVFK